MSLELYGVPPVLANRLKVPGMAVPDVPNSTLTAVDSRSYYIRFIPLRPMTIVKAAIGIQTAAAANDNVDIGILDATGTKIVSSGATPGKLNAAAFSSPTVDLAATTLQAGVQYWVQVAFGAFGGSAVVLVSSGFGGAAGARMFEQVAGVVDQYTLNLVKASQTTVATQVLTGLSPTANVPSVALRES